MRDRCGPIRGSVRLVMKASANPQSGCMFATIDSQGYVPDADALERAVAEREVDREGPIGQRGTANTSPPQGPRIHPQKGTGPTEVTKRLARIAFPGPVRRLVVRVTRHRPPFGC